MKQKSIRLHPHEVRGILYGRQSQLRRILKPQPWSGASYGGVGYAWSKKGEDSSSYKWNTNMESLARHIAEDSPYGQPGDIVWVKETFGLTINVNSQPDWPGRPHTLLEEGYCTIYRADGEWQWLDEDGFSTEKSYWKPSTHMPKAAARIFLRITDIRVERLQDITEMDAFAEGIDDEGDNYIEAEQARLAGAQVSAGSPAQHSFSCLWERINGPDSWAANPWVWVVSFEKIDKPE